MRRLLAALLIVLPVAPRSLAAQDATQAWLLTPGARVRITYPGSDARVGTLVALTADSVALQWAGRPDTTRFARAEMSRLAVSRGMRAGDRGARAKIGMMVGAGGVLMIAKFSGSGGSGGLEDVSAGIVTMMGAALAGGVGALIGAASGGPSEMWEDVRLTQPRPGLVVPTRNQNPGIGSTMTF